MTAIFKKNGPHFDPLPKPQKMKLGKTKKYTNPKFVPIDARNLKIIVRNIFRTHT